MAGNDICSDRIEFQHGDAWHRGSLDARMHFRNAASCLRHLREMFGFLDGYQRLRRDCFQNRTLNVVHRSDTVHLMNR